MGLRRRSASRACSRCPGGSHGETAAGVPYSVQIVPSLVAWTEQRRPPAKLDAVARDAGGNVTRTYPVFANPTRARCTGSGDVDGEASWVAATPLPLPDDHFDWLGDPRGWRHGVTLRGGGRAWPNDLAASQVS